MEKPEDDGAADDDEIAIRVQTLENHVKRMMRTKHDALTAELEPIKDYLGMEPRIRAFCPSCGKKWNKRPVPE